MKKILSFFGLVSQRDMDSQIGKYKYELETLKPFFEKPETEVRWDQKLYTWNEYWNLYLANKYIAYNIRCISKDPDLLQKSILAISEFPWDKCVENYKNQNWCWDDDKTPSKSKMIGSVIALIKLINDEGDVIESGGFTVKYKDSKLIILKPMNRNKFFISIIWK